MPNFISNRTIKHQRGAFAITAGWGKSFSLSIHLSYSSGEVESLSAERDCSALVR